MRSHNLTFILKNNIIPSILRLWMQKILHQGYQLMIQK